MARRRVVMAFGAFDGVHMGHVYYLKKARELGGKLVVAVARENALWRFHRKYYLPEGERKELVEGLGIANDVIFGSEDRALEKITELKPDIIAITKYHLVDPELLRKELESKGLKTKVEVIEPYKPDIYDACFRLGEPLRKRDLLGLPPKVRKVKKT